jgi:hypothetical protein
VCVCVGASVLCVMNGAEYKICNERVKNKFQCQRLSV